MTPEGLDRDDKIAMWLADPLPSAVRARIVQLASVDDVVQIAVMPDVHLASDYCVGTVVATRSRIFPHAVGGDIGCGVTAMRVQSDARHLHGEKGARQLLQTLCRFIPAIRHGRGTVCDRLPDELMDTPLSDGRLERLKARDGRVQFGTLGRGNHFLEFQTDPEERLWIMLHSGSRAMGQAIACHHLAKAERDGGIPYFLDGSQEGRDYLNDATWARAYARHNRLAMLGMTAELLRTLWNVDVDETSLIESDHNHVRRESHRDQLLWVHRKGAQSASAGESGLIPGSMGTPSYHVEGRGCAAALRSSSHGAGRSYSRSEARAKFSASQVRRQMGSVHFDERKLRQLLDEAPGAYRDIRKVMQAQRDLVKCTLELRPILSYKGM